MGIRIIEGQFGGDSNGHKVLYCSTTMWAFGPVFFDDEDPDNFIDYCERKHGVKDLRTVSDSYMESLVSQWRSVWELINLFRGDEKIDFDQKFLAGIEDVELNGLDPDDAPDFVDTWVETFTYDGVKVDVECDAVSRMNYCRAWINEQANLQAGGA